MLHLVAVYQIGSMCGMLLVSLVVCHVVVIMMSTLNVLYPLVPIGLFGYFSGLGMPFGN